MKIIALNLLLILSVNLIAQQVQKPICGEIVHIKNFPSKLVEPRNIDIWLPDNYNKESKYSVLYMHDGQNLFDSTTTWNKRSWDVDDIACKLMKSKKINNLIVVGIWSEGVNRHQNYFPQKSFESLSMMEKDTIINQLKNSVMSKDFIRPNSDNYLKYIVTELKPFID
jgi:predicted alpha/beta superfamily hydrolase